uniref:Nuclear transport factor 2 family protein n=1 Tax=Eiseniibacteriota bacterium TaxID=2212470 RepID=A0A832I572_UNCEI
MPCACCLPLPARPPARARGALRAAAGALAVAALATAAAAATPEADSLAAAERAFARAAVERGMRTAFLEYLAPDAILFRPGPVHGPAAWRGRPESPAVLDWRPAFVEVSGAGDAGFSTGPWTLRATRDAAPTAHGQFVSVWRRARGGPWRVVLDIGISHADPGVPLDRVETASGPRHAPPDTNAWRRSGVDLGAGVRRNGTGVGAGTGGAAFSWTGRGGGIGAGFGTAGIRSRRDYEWRRTAHEKHTLMSAERAFAFVATRHGWARAYREMAAADLRHLREGFAPAIGPEPDATRLPAPPAARTWLPRGHGVAASWDLGWAWGIVVTRTRDAAPDSAGYARLWRKDEAGAWRLVIDVESPFPRRP